MIFDQYGKPIRIKANYNTIPNLFSRGLSVGVDSILPSRLTRQNQAAQSRKHYIDNPVFAGIVNKLITLIVGSGMRPTSTSNNAAFRDAFNDVFSRWITRPDIAQSMTLDGVVRMVALGLVLDGESFIILTKSTNGYPRVQIIDPSLVGYGEDDGIIKDSVGEIKGYKIFKGMKDKEPDFIEYSSDVASLIYLPISPNQSRGVPMFASALNTLQDITEIWEAQKKLIKAATNQLGFIKTQSGEVNTTSDIFEKTGGLTSEDIAALASESEVGNVDVSKIKYYQKIGENSSTQLWTLQHQDDLQFLETQMPHDNTQQFISQLVRVCANVSGIPASVLSEDYQGGVAARRDIALAQKRIYEIQQVITSSLTKVFKYVVKVETELGNLPETPDALNHSWQYPSDLTADFGRA